MYRSLSMYPKSADPARVEEVVQRSTAVFRRRAGFRSCTTSVDALMGPGAKGGEFARVVVVDFDTLEDRAVTVRDRDTMEQDRVAMDQVAAYLRDKLA